MTHKTQQVLSLFTSTSTIEKEKAERHAEEKAEKIGTKKVPVRPVTMETRCFHKKLEFQRYLVPVSYTHLTLPTKA